MTPLQINLLLHAHCVREKPHPGYHNAAPSLIDAALIEQVSANHYYETTDRGEAMVKMLRAVPLPKTVFIDPRNGEVIG